MKYYAAQKDNAMQLSLTFLILPQTLTGLAFPPFTFFLILIFSLAVQI